MSKALTKAQLADQLIALRQHCDLIETKLAGYQLAEYRAKAAAPAPAVVVPTPSAPAPRCWSDRFGRTFEKRVTWHGGRAITTNVRVA